MEPLERIARLLAMIEIAHVDRAKLRVPSRMLDVAGDAVASGVPVHAFTLRDALCDRTVAGEAAVDRDLAPLLVALRTVLEPLELRVRLREFSRRDQVTELRRRVAGHREANRGGNERRPQQPLRRG